MTPLRARKVALDPVSSAPSRRGRVAHLRVERSDAELTRGLREGARWAQAALYDAHAPAVLRLLRRLVGRDHDIDERDLLQDVFVDALASIERLDDPAALSGWLRTIATRKAFRAIRAKRMRRWLRFWEPIKTAPRRTEHLEPEVLEAYERTYRVLEQLSPALRVPFTLRFIEGLELTAVAEACECSLATAKRRLAKASSCFRHMAQHDAVLREWLERGERWT